MRLTKGVLSLRSRSHVNTRLQLRDERIYTTRLLPWLALVNVSFTVVDSLVSHHGGPLFFGAIRVSAVLASWALFLLSRGRVRYGTRLLCVVGPYILCVEYIMASQGLIYTPYFSGLILVMVTSTMLFPVKARVAAEVYGLALAPILIWSIFHGDGSLIDQLNVMLMALGSVFVCSINSGQVYGDLRARLEATEELARDLGRRETEIRSKARQLVKRQAFESQFSPQVVKAVLRDPATVKERSKRQLVVLVLDIENSTAKATSLPGDQYDEVIEEVYDVFASACLQWDVTVDKFTGDGGMAFAGAPVHAKDDFRRALMACKETLRMLAARKEQLDSRWGERLNVRMSLAEGMARVGFIGRGTLKTYTAVGEVVSFTHRLASSPSPWSIATYSWTDPGKLEELYPGLTSFSTVVSGLKGFGARQFPIRVFTPVVEVAETLNVGRCDLCGTPLIFDENEFGFPRIACPGCILRSGCEAA